MDENLKILNTLSVKENGRSISRLNELEFIQGKIWSNVWYSNKILIIDPKTGIVEDSLDLSSVANKYTSFGVLNGIAFNENKCELFVTGKNWPLLLQIKVPYVEKNCVSPTTTKASKNSI